MADITQIFQVVKNGSVVQGALGAAAASDTIPTCTGKELLVVTNGAGAPINVTISAHEDCDQGSAHDLVISVANATTRILGPFLPPARFANPTTGKIDIAWSSLTTITRGVIKTL